MDKKLRAWAKELTEKLIRDAVIEQERRVTIHHEIATLSLRVHNLEEENKKLHRKLAGTYLKGQSTHIG